MEQNDHDWLLTYEEYYDLVMEAWYGTSQWPKD